MFIGLIIVSYSIPRYLEYFIGLLSGEIKLNSLPLYLTFIKMESPPCMHHKISYHENEWSSFIKIFEGERFVFISGKTRSMIFLWNSSEFNKGKFKSFVSDEIF